MAPKATQETQEAEQPQPSELEVLQQENEQLALELSVEKAKNKELAELVQDLLADQQSNANPAQVDESQLAGVPVRQPAEQIINGMLVRNF